MTNCPNCEKAKTTITGAYNFNCNGCKTRFIQNEPCKYYRKVLVEQFGKKYGAFEGWQEGANCGCERICKRKAAVEAGKPMEPIYEQSVNANRKKAPRRR
jgi:hypothetical protein